MATFLLIRHASCDGLDRRIAGRLPGVHLNSHGKQEANQLAERLAQLPIGAIYSSPLERAQESAEAIASRLHIPPEIDDDLDEIDYGNWAGKNLKDLEGLASWKQYNACRCSAQIPGGENMRQVASRARRVVQRLCRLAPEDCFALVSHADWIRVAVSEYTKVSLDVLKMFQVDPASVSVLRVEDWGSVMVRWNDTGPLASAVKLGALQ